jgi:4-aminobutyrate aminotransferase-like enzyme
MALTLIRGATGKRGIICTDASYHGNSSLVGRLSWLPVGTERSGVKSISTPQLFRPLKADVSEADLLQHHLDELATTIASFDDEGGFAGLMLCSILANEGLPNPPAGWFAEAVDLVHDAGGLVIADEVQAGFARSGSWWGYETSSFVPDVVCMGKPMGNGFPLSAMASSHDLITGFRQRQRYFNTFASSPLQAAAGAAVIDEIIDRGLVDQVVEVGDRLKTSLAALQRDHPRMGDVRGTGLFIGIDWVHPQSNEPDVDGAGQMVEALKSRGMLLGKTGQHGNVLKIRPPLVFDHDNSTTFLDVFADTVADAHS